MTIRRRRAPEARHPQVMDVRYEELSAYGRKSVRRNRMPVHWRGEGEQTACGRWLAYSIWADEEVEAVTCVPCRRAMAIQEVRRML